MSVLAKDRSLSKLEFYMNARKLQLQMLHLMARDFGIKPKAREPNFYTSHMEESDRETLQAILLRYRIEKIVEDYPEWMIQMFRKRVIGHLQYMMDSITQAYTIWATNISEANDRRLSQDHAISACEMLKQDMELLVDILPIKADKLIRYIDSINREIALLKGWRKSDNKRNKTLK
jgi:hypothetical protein